MASSNDNTEATTFGATIVSPEPPKTPKATTKTTSKPNGLAPISTPNLTPSPSSEDLTAITTPPTITSTLSHPAYSPFYEHDRSPLARAPNSYSSNNSPSAAAPAPLSPLILNEKDLERGTHVTTTPLLSIPRDPESPFSTRISLQRTTTSALDSNLINGKEDGMWPSKQYLLRGRQAEKKRRRDRKFCGGCHGVFVEFWGKRSKKQRLGLKVLLAVFVLGLAVTIGLCISIAVHGGVYAGHGQEKGINVDGQR